MMLLQRLQSIGFDIALLQSTDLRLWSDRRAVLFFLLKADEELVRSSLEAASNEFQFDDETTRTSKAFYQVFSAFHLDYLTLENLLGVTYDCNVFLESVIDLVEVMQASQTDSVSQKSEIAGSNQKNDTYGLEGFMSNYALLECASSRMKDLTKEEIELFPANLKAEASHFTTHIEHDLEQCFNEVLSKTDDLKHKLIQLQFPPEEAPILVNKFSDGVTHHQNLVEMKESLQKFVHESSAFIKELPNCLRINGDRLKGIGPHAKAIMYHYHELVHCSELLKSNSVTMNELKTITQPEEWSQIQQLIRQIGNETSLMKPKNRMR